MGVGVDVRVRLGLVGILMVLIMCVLAIFSAFSIFSILYICYQLCNRIYLYQKHIQYHKLNKFNIKYPLLNIYFLHLQSPIPYPYPYPYLTSIYIYIPPHIHNII